MTPLSFLFLILAALLQFLVPHDAVERKAPAGGALQDATLAIGQPAPPLRIERILDRDEAEIPGWEQLSGQAVVLEFWATWCQPCVASIPHLNELQSEFSDEPIQFISITDEEAPTVREFLERRPIKGWVGLDDDGATYASYEADTIPRTVLVDRKGIVRAITRASALNAQVLRDLLDGKDLGLEDESQSPRAKLGRTRITTEGPEPIQLALIRPSAEDFFGQETNPKEGTSRFFGHDARQLLQAAYRVSAPYFILETSLPEGRFDATFRSGARPDLMWPTMELAVQAALGVVVTRDERESDVYVLRADHRDEEALKVLESGGGSFWSTEGELSGVIGIGGLVSSFEEALGTPVVDESGLEGIFVVRSVKWDPKSPEDFVAKVRATLGLDLVPTRKAMTQLVVRKPAK